MTPEPKVFSNLKLLCNGEFINPWTNKVITQNDIYNDLLFCYWYFFDGFMREEVFFKPNNLTSFTPIDRGIRELPEREKNISEQERYRKYYCKNPQT